MAEVFDDLAMLSGGMEADEEQGTATPTGTGLDLAYSDYTSRGGAAVPEAEWTTYKTAATDTIRDVTFGRCDTTTDADELERLAEALRRVADAHYAVENGATSESVGSYSVTRGAAAAPDRGYPIRVARAALAGTGLTYAGVRERVHRYPYI